MATMLQMLWSGFHKYQSRTHFSKGNKPHLGECSGGLRKLHFHLLFRTNLVEGITNEDSWSCKSVLDEK